MMNIKSHGDWQRYQPSRLPPDAPPSALFARRIGDGVDWYDYVNSGENFADDSIKLTVTDGRVGAAVTDPTLLFPGNGAVIEVFDARTSDPQKAFGMKSYDATHKTFSDPPPLPQVPTIEELVARIEALEAKGT
jgi:hypothetical protein